MKCLALIVIFNDYTYSGKIYQLKSCQLLIKVVVLGFSEIIGPWNEAPANIIQCINWRKCVLPPWWIALSSTTKYCSQRKDKFILCEPCTRWLGLQTDCESVNDWESAFEFSHVTPQMCGFCSKVVFEMNVLTLYQTILIAMSFPFHYPI